MACEPFECSGARVKGGLGCPDLLSHVEELSVVIPGRPHRYSLARIYRRLIGLLNKEKVLEHIEIAILFGT